MRYRSHTNLVVRLRQLAFKGGAGSDAETGYASRRRSPGRSPPLNGISIHPRTEKRSERNLTEGAWQRLRPHIITAADFLGLWPS